MKLFGIQFAPICVPLERRLQTLAAGGWFVFIVFGGSMGCFLAIYLIFFTEWIRYLVIIYIAWIYYDRDTCIQGGRRQRYTRWIRRCSWWAYFRDYFPIKLYKTADLDPSRNYLLCSFPHGILATGAFASFATDSLNFHKLFPGLEPRLITLTQHFMFPFFRECIYAFGACSSKAESLECLLKHKKSSDPDDLNKAVILIVGGAAEALMSRPSTYRTLCNKRKGFVKIALKTGTPLVPVFSFGETDLFDQIVAPKNSLLNRIQEFFRKNVGVIPVLVIGRGFFQYSFGIIPRRRPISVVVGSPIEVPKVTEPTREEINKYHDLFKEKLIELFETEKHKYLENADNIKLSIE
ncbi:2-acylglycerol O-acyltransferase 2-A-like [Chelonus insularis]|uniref:2-acylglycerol O-acyltransferase 2-A-like n=1 Tax=Chelonus insularis TaxID=460826 RepID=UPI0015888312|nr:2-acylglycerol O-acyltransferase 2-A-like [Chelonus insularis]